MTAESELKRSLEASEAGFEKEPMERFYAHPFAGIHSRRRVRRILKELMRVQGGIILDIGCEAGHVSLKIAETGRAVLPVDHSRDAVMKLKDRLSKRAHPNVIGPLVGLGHSLPLKAGSVEAVVCSEVIQLTPFLEALFNELARVLRREGWLILTFPNEPLKKRLYPLANLLGVDTSAQEEITPFQYGPEDVRKALSGRFSIIEAHALPSSLFPLTHFIIGRKR